MFILMSLSHGRSNLQLSSAAFNFFNLFAILVPSGRFSCSSQVCIISSFITSLLEQGPQGWPKVSYLHV